jgi:outer membrane protein insertion porin family
MFLLIGGLSTGNTYAQNLSTSDDTTLVVRKLRFSGNKFANSTTLETIVRSKTNRELFTITGFTPWYWVWQLAPKIGEPPARLDRNILNNDVKRINEYYRSNGYLESEVRTSIVEYKKGKVELSFIIDEGKPSFIRNIYYSGVPIFEETPIQDRFFRSSQLKGSQLSDTSFYHNQRLTFESITLERERIISFLKDQGYASVQNDSVTAELRRDPSNQNQIDLLFKIKSGKIYSFGDIDIKVVAEAESDQGSAIEQTSSFKINESETTYNLRLSREQQSRVKFSLLNDRLLIEPGERYNHQKYLRSVNRYQDLGIFSVRRFALDAEGGLPNFEQENLPVFIELQTLPQHRIGFDFFGLQRYGFGAGAGVRYSNSNVRKGAENLDLSLRGSFELYDQNLLSAFEASSRYTLPRLLFPFKNFNQKDFFIDSRTSYSIGLNQVRQLNFDINANLSFNNRFEVRHTSLLTSDFDLLDVEIIDANATSEFITQLEERFQNNPQLIVFILEDFRPQVSSVLRYTLRRTNTDIIKRNRGSYQEYTIEYAGLLPFLTDRFIVSPDTLEGNLPGFYLKSLDYTQYIKLSGDYRRYKTVGSSSTLSYRGFAGAAITYGVNNIVPITRRFFAGGSNDVRGWAPLKLGPGQAQDEKSFNGGEIKLFSQLEFRQMLVQNVWGSDVYAGYFIDAGNVWLSRRNDVSRTDLQPNLFRFDTFAKQIAVGAGTGVRIDWDYVIFRLDMAFRVHDLDHGWLNNKKAYFHFGIGHAF